VPRLAQLVRRGVGLNTRVGAARFVVSIAARLGSDLQPFAPALLKVRIGEKYPALNAVPRTRPAALCARHCSRWMLGTPLGPVHGCHIGDKQPILGPHSTSRYQKATGRRSSLGGRHTWNQCPILNAKFDHLNPIGLGGGRKHACVVIVLEGNDCAGGLRGLRVCYGFMHSAWCSAAP
jgi:hypothetical protein